MIISLNSGGKKYSIEMVILAACFSIELCCLLLLEDYVPRLQPSVKVNMVFTYINCCNLLLIVIILSHILYYLWTVILVNAPR